MTKTIQPYSRAYLNETGKNLTRDKSKIEDNVRLLSLLCDSLNNLYESLSKLNYIMGLDFPRERGQ